MRRGHNDPSFGAMVAQQGAEAGLAFASGMAAATAPETRRCRKVKANTTPSSSSISARNQGATAIISVWLDPSVITTEIDPEVLFITNREATAKAIHKAMCNEPSIDWLLENQNSVPHFFHQLALEGKI